MLTRGLLLVLGGLLAVGGVACDQPSAAQVAKGGKVVFVAKSRDNVYFDQIGSGFGKAAGELNGDFEMVAPDTADAASQIELIKRIVDGGVKVLAIAPNGSDAVAPALAEAIQKGVIVVTVDSDTVGHEDARNVAVLPADAKAVGDCLTDMMSDLMYGRGDFAVLSSTADAPNQNAWIDAMKADLASNPAYKGLKLVDVVYGNDRAGPSAAACEELLAKDPNLRGICSPTTIGILAAAKTLDMTGKYPQVKLTGLGLPSQMRPFMQDGVVRKFALWDPETLGYLAGQVCFQAANGSFKPAPNATVSCGIMGKRMLDGHGVISGDPPVVFTADNVAQYSF